MVRCVPHRFAFVALALAALRVSEIHAQTIISGIYNGPGANITGDIAIASSTNATFTGGVTFTGTNATFNNSSGLYWQQVGTLSGKAFTFGSGAFLQVVGVNNALTFGNTTSATGILTIYSDGNNGTAFTNQGALTHTSGSGSIYARTFTNSGTITATGGTLYLGLSSASYTSSNSGTITADGSSTDVHLRGNFANTGTIRAQNSGTLYFEGTNASTNFGTVQIGVGSHAYLNGTITNTSATLNAPATGTYELLGGTISGGTIAAGALTFTSSSGYFDGATLTGNLTLPASTSLRFTNGGGFTGSAANFNTGSGLYWQQAGTLSGKAFTFGSSAFLQIAGVNNTLTFDNTVTASGNLTIYSDGNNGTAFTNQGALTHTGGTGSIYARTFTNSGPIMATGGTLYLGLSSASYTSSNSGTITADGGSTDVHLRGDFTNTGTIRAQNSGTLYFEGTNASANLGTVQIGVGSHGYLNGTITNTSATLNAPTTGTYELYGGTISGGTIAAGALTFTNNGGYLDGATLTGNLTLPASASLRFTNGGGFTGSAASFNSNSGLYWQQAGTLSGKAFTFGSGAFLQIAGVNNTLTFDNTVTASGNLTIYSDGNNGTAFTNQGALTHTTGSGSIYARTFTNSGPIMATGGTLYLGLSSASYTSSNSGTITADGGSTDVHLRGDFTNTGTIRAQNSGTLYFEGTNSSAHLGTVQIGVGSHGYLNGTITNTSTTLNAPATGTYELLGGTISGGTIAAGALTFTSSSGYFDGATLTGNLTLPISASLRFTNGGGFTGSAANLNNSSGLYWQQVGTLSGKTFTFGSGAFLQVAGVNNTLTFDNTVTASGNLTIYSDGNNGTAFTNQGALTHTTGSGSIYARTFTNSGTIMATGGTLYLGISSAPYTSSNSGTITADGSITDVHLRGDFANTGTIRAQNSGTLYFEGTNTAANLGTVQIGVGSHGYLNGTLTNTGTLNAPATGTYELLGGTISGGTIAAGALTFTNSSGYFDGATLTGNLTLPASTSLRFTNGGGFTGSAANFNNSSGLYWQQAGTLSGKTFTFGSGAFLQVAGANNTLTFGNTTSATGVLTIYSDGNNGAAFTNQGALSHTSGTGSIYARTLVNSGPITATGGTLYLGLSSASYTSSNSSTITADGSSTDVHLRGDFTNTGTIRAQNSGTLYFEGTNASANLGTVQIGVGSHAYLNGTITNTSATLNAPTTGTYELYGGTISGGTIAAGALTFTSNSGYLDGATLTGNLTLPASTSVRFTNGGGFTGPLADLGANAGLYWQEVGTLAGKALQFANGAFLQIIGLNNTLTFDNTVTASGDLTIYSDGNNGTVFTNQGALTHTTGTGSIYARTFANSGTITATGGTLYLGLSSASYTSSNSGMITADGSSTDVHFRGAFTNTGTIRAQNSGTLYFEGTNPSANLGTVQIGVGSHGYLNGTITNTSATLNTPATGTYELLGGTISGGTVAAGALTFTSSGGYLDGTTFTGNLVLPASSYVRLLNGATFTGSSATFGSNASVYWQQIGTLAGKALTFGSSSALYLSGANSALTFGSTSTATGDVKIYADGSAGTALTIQGAVTHTASSTGYLYANAFTNSGSIIASAGSLVLGSTSTGATFTNSSGALIRTTGSGTIVLQAPGSTPIVNNGTVDVQGGTLYTGNHLTNGSGGTLSGAGAINGNVVAAGGTLAPGNSIGALTFQNGTLTVTNPTLFAVELSGTSSDQLVFQNPPSVVNIGSGLLTLSLTLLAPPAPNTIYDLVRITSGGSGITGTFAGLPGSGSTFSTMFGGNSYSFSVNYQPNLISLASVPEPSTYALLGLGALVLAWQHQRRRSRPTRSSTN